MSTGVFKLSRPVLTEDAPALVLASNEKKDVTFQFAMTPEWYQLFNGRRTLFAKAEYDKKYFRILKIVGDRDWNKG